MNTTLFQHILISLAMGLVVARILMGLQHATLDFTPAPGPWMIELATALFFALFVSESMERVKTKTK